MPRLMHLNEDDMVGWRRHSWHFRNNTLWLAQNCYLTKFVKIKNVTKHNRNHTNSWLPHDLRLRSCVGCIKDSTFVRKSLRYVLAFLHMHVAAWLIYMIPRRDTSLCWKSWWCLKSIFSFVLKRLQRIICLYWQGMEWRTHFFLSFVSFPVQQGVCLNRWRRVLAFFLFFLLYSAARGTYDLFSSVRCARLVIMIVQCFLEELRITDAPDTWQTGLLASRFCNCLRMLKYWKNTTVENWVNMKVKTFAQ